MQRHCIFNFIIFLQHAIYVAMLFSLGGAARPIRRGPTILRANNPITVSSTTTGHSTLAPSTYPHDHFPVTTGQTDLVPRFIAAVLSPQISTINSRVAVKDFRTEGTRSCFSGFGTGGLGYCSGGLRRGRQAQLTTVTLPSKDGADGRLDSTDDDAADRDKPHEGEPGGSELGGIHSGAMPEVVSSNEDFQGGRDDALRPERAKVPQVPGIWEGGDKPAPNF